MPTGLHQGPTECSDEGERELLADALASNDPFIVVTVLRMIAAMRGLNSVVALLQDDNPRLDAVLKALQALGLTLDVLGL